MTGQADKWGYRTARRQFLKAGAQFTFGALCYSAFNGCVRSDIQVRTPPQVVSQIPVVDIHSHLLPRYLRSDIGTTPQMLMAAMDEAGIGKMIIAGFGSELEQISRQYPGRLYASYILYNFRWRQDKRFHRLIPENLRIKDGSSPGEVERIGNEFEQAVKTGRYCGIGEVTTVSKPIRAGIAGNRSMLPGSTVLPDSPLVLRLIHLAGSYDVPIIIHCEQEEAGPMVAAVRSYPKTRVIWAHAGSYLAPEKIASLLAQHPNLNFDLSSLNRLYQPRAPVLIRGGRLSETWQTVLEAYPDRFYFGVDFLTAPQLASASRIGDDWRLVLTQLGRETAEKISYRNALQAFGIKQ